MGKIVMPKNSALLNEIESVLQIYYGADDWLPNDEYKTKLKSMIGDDQYSSSYTKKAQITSYFGFTIWEDINNPQSRRKITPSGKKMYEAIKEENTAAVQEVLMNALETVKFGRDNYGCPESSSDVEPPSLYVRAILDMGYLTYREFAFLLWKLEDLGANYTDALAELKALRSRGSIDLGEEANKYADCKPIMILVRWGFLAEDTADVSGGKHIIIAPKILSKYETRLRNLKIYNVDMDCGIVTTEDYKERFRTWLENQVKPEGDSEAGQPYSPNTIDQYVSNLDNTYLPNGKSVFFTSDIDEVKQCAEELKNTEPKNNTQKSALQKYIEFLVSNQKPVFHTGYEHPKGFANNRIIFGAPGTGKSFTINNDRKDLLGEDNEVDYERVTFHPDYSYANFVGTYKPVPCKKHNDKGEEEDSITYEYVPGPFMRMYVKALKNARTDSPKPFLLIIEEINRANVAAVFGDVFQLLDRGDDNVSEYPIQASEDIKKYLARELGGDPENYSKIRIPDNMFIWATMNSADQGVYPMDTAFKRRWDFTYLGIDDSDKDIRGKYVTVGNKEKQKIEWNELRKAINEFLANDLKINEDKLLGPYFISRNIVVPVGDKSEIDSKKFSDVFKNKVLMYLFEDAAKQKRSTLFEGSAKGHNRYSKICEAFDEQGIGIFNAKIQNRVKVQDLMTNGHELDENGMVKTEE